MATVNLGRIKPVFRGAYSGSTAYVVDDIVTHGNESFICIQAHGAGTQATSVTAYWTKLAAKGADGTDGDTFGLANKEIAFKTNAGALDGIAIGTAGQALKVNSGATGYEFGTISSKLIGMEKIYFSDTAVAFSSESGTQLSGSTYYPNSAKISGTYNKQQSSSHILMLVKYSLGHSSTNLHGSVAWVTGKESAYRNMGFDARQNGWYHDEGSVGFYTQDVSVFWNGASSSEVQGTGNMTFNFVGAVDGTRTHTHTLNANPYSAGSSGGNHTDCPNRNTHSEIIIMEYEA